MENIAQHAVFQLGEVEISSEFDSGNIASAVEASTYCYELWTGPDGMGTGGENSCRTWFFFRVQTSLRVSLQFTVKNLNLQSKLFKDGMKPVWKTHYTGWQRVSSDIITATNNGNFEITFSHLINQESTFFAFTYPWTFQDHLNLIHQLNQDCIERNIFYYVENIINSLESRPCHLLTISSIEGVTDKREKKIPGLFPEGGARCPKFEGKKVVFVSSRVHPGEIPSSHVLNGFLKFITSQDRRAEILRGLYVFKVIPILNPDGVFRGYYRTDTKGTNLNRLYSNPSPSEHPTIFATKELYNYYQSISEVFLYVDLHGHASKKGCFIYGNYMEFKDQIETCMFAKLMALNCINFDFQGSNFTESNMRAKDKRDGLSKEGSGRVAFFKQTGNLRCYTLECNYNTGRLVNSITRPEDDITDNASDYYSNGPPKYDVSVYEDVGRAIAVSLLDLTGANPITRVPSPQDLRLDVASYVASMIPFRFDPAIKKASKSLVDLENYFLEKIKEETKKPPRPEKNFVGGRNRSDGKREESSGKENSAMKEENFRLRGRTGAKDRLSSGIPKAGIREKVEGNERNASRERSLDKGVKKEPRGVSVVPTREIVFMPQVKESSSQRGRSLNQRISRKIITQNTSLSEKK